ncbi:MAG: hypothetical protein ACRBDL_09440 [Alphaproteobacteria bacterium]
MKITQYFIATFLCSATLFVASCGIKPPHVEPPEGAEHDTFPATYPDTSTDPRPGLEHKPQ